VIISKLQFEARSLLLQAGATKFLVGCESGAILSCNRKAKNPSDRVAGAFYGHHGPVYGLKRHPFAVKYFLSVGDWTARIWAEDLKQPLITTRYQNTYLTGVNAMCPTQRKNPCRL
jgi:dynein intermediate chain 2, axonemal